MSCADFLSHMLEQLLNTCSLFRTRLKEIVESIFIFKLLAFTMRHLDLLEQVCLVTHEADVDVSGCIILY